MDFLARKIARAKWEKKPFLDANEPSADALTGCLRTKNNALSVWQCPATDKENVKEAVLALASIYDQLDKMHVIVLPKADLESIGFELIATTGNTHVADLADKHLDISKLSGTLLLTLARFIAPRVRNDTACYTFSKGEVKTILQTAIANGRLHKDQLHPRVQEALG